MLKGKVAYEVYPLQLSSKLIAYFPPPPLPPYSMLLLSSASSVDGRKKLDAARSSVPSPNIVFCGEGGGGAWATSFDEGGRVFFFCPLQTVNYGQQSRRTMLGGKGKKGGWGWSPCLIPNLQTVYTTAASASLRSKASLLSSSAFANSPHHADRGVAAARSFIDFQSFSPSRLPPGVGGDRIPSPSRPLVGSPSRLPSFIGGNGLANTF